MSSGATSRAGVSMHTMEGPVDGPWPVPGRIADAILRAAPVAKLVRSANRCFRAAVRRSPLLRTLRLDGAPGGRRRRSGRIAMPAELSYAANHLWLEVGESGQCHPASMLSEPRNRQRGTHPICVAAGAAPPAAILTRAESIGK